MRKVFIGYWLDNWICIFWSEEPHPVWPNMERFRDCLTWTSPSEQLYRSIPSVQLHFPTYEAIACSLFSHNHILFHTIPWLEIYIYIYIYIYFFCYDPYSKPDTNRQGTAEKRFFSLHFQEACFVRGFVYEEVTLFPVFKLIAWSTKVQHIFEIHEGEMLSTPVFKSIAWNTNTKYLLSILFEMNTFPWEVPLIIFLGIWSWQRVDIWVSFCRTGKMAVCVLFFFRK